MSRVNYVVVFSSPKYRELIYSSLRRNEMMFVEPVKEDEKYISEYVKTGTLEIGHYDAFVIDLGSLKDTDEQIIEAIEAIRFLDDRVRIIIMEGNRNGCELLFHKCFLNGIYNLIEEEDFIITRERLEDCLLEGMTYKDALEFRDIDSRKNHKKEDSKTVEFSNRKIAFWGSQRRIGTTTCVLATAFTLRKSGYLVAVIDCTGSGDYLELMNSYEQKLLDGKDFTFTIDDIDFYINTSGEDISTKIQRNSYNFIIYDLGFYKDCFYNEKRFWAADEKVMVIGSKPWELPWVADVVRALENKEIKYLFNLANNGLEKELRKLMKDVGIATDVYFMEYLEDYFSVSEAVKSMLQVIPKKVKKGWFCKK